ncbi:hypothetical protein FB451DRAFT_1291960 [Mycena latifolia]|nr:hypothetical protein FB451DRAFT_1291960 [Mycena latifolia]
MTKLYLTLFTHLCVHVLWLMGKPVLALLFSIAALFTSWIHLVLMPTIWPGLILLDTLRRIEATRTHLHDEAARRRTVGMYHLSTEGLHRLAVLEREVDDTLAAHRAHLNAPFSYASVAFSLYQRARRCQHDAEMLCQELGVKIERFDGIGNRGHDSDTAGAEEAASTESCSQDWLDPVLTALTNQSQSRGASGALHVRHTGGGTC